MEGTDFSKIAMPRTRLPFRPSRTALGLLLATAMLAVLLAFSTVENINRAQMLMEGFLLEKGQTIIRSIEAGSRTSVMHHMGSGNPLHTLLSENIRENDIVFIIITDSNGTTLEKVGSMLSASLIPENRTSLFDSDIPLTQMDSKSGLFVVSKAFMQTAHQAEVDRIISVGLLTKEFDIARKQDVHHAMLMGGILFLVGTAGLYFLFLYQGVRIARSTLADMKLYTDSVIESIPVSLATLDAGNRVVSCNHNCEELLGQSLNELRGKNISTLLPHCSLCTSSTCNDANEHPTEYRTSQDTIVPIRLSCSTLVNHDGESIGRVLIIRDMSSIRDLEVQLERSRRLAALGKMAAGIAHEIRNPLGTLRGFAQYFGNQATTDTERQYADLMVSEADRLNTTVSGLLQFARPREPQFQKVKLDNLVTKLIALMNPDLANRDLRFHCTLDEGLTLHVDPDLLLQVLMNLLKNSIHASEPGGQITLNATEEKNTIKISVIDFGHGMAEKEREQMFDPFFTTGKNGTGLGLTVSHQIIEQHHGSFEVLTAPEQGTTVTLTLPKELQGS